MTIDPQGDPLVDGLSQLATIVPRAAHDDRVVRRCHLVLAAGRRRTERRPGRVSDVLVGAAAALYVVAAISEAIRLLGAAG